MRDMWTATRSASRGFLRRLWVLVLFLNGLPLLAAPKFTAALDRNSIIAGETVNLTLSIEGGRPQHISQLPQIDGLQFASGVSQGFNSSTAADGTTTTVQTYSVSLTATRAGSFVIPAFEAKVDGQTLNSQPITLNVAATDTAGPPADYAAKPVFFWPVLPKKELYFGEVLVTELRLYIRGDIRRISEPQLPLSGEGFTFSKVLKGQQFQRKVGNSPFTVVTYYVALTPVKTGSLTVGPINGAVVLNPPDPMESFFGGGPRPQQVPLTLDQITINVSPVPTRNAPADFTGAVGKFSMTTTAGPTNVAVGDPVTVKVQIAGTGLLDAITLPEQKAWTEFKTYPPTSRSEPGDDFGIQGTKYFEQVVVPQNTDIKSIPPVSFSYFDPDLRSFQTLSQPAIPLIVRPGGSTPAPTITTARSGDNTPPPSQDIVPIKQRIGNLAAIERPLIRQPWFLALQSAPILAFVFAVVWRRRTESLANNPRLRRQRQVAVILRDGLAELRRRATENNSDEFFATLFRLLQEQLGERLDLPASAITEAVIEEHLRPRSVPDDLLGELHELFQSCNLARYAPIRSSQELTALIPRLENVLGRIKELRL